jgi:nicotinamidase-related amidase
MKIKETAMKIKLLFLSLLTCFVAFHSAAPAQESLTPPGMGVDSRNTALVITDPQNDFLSPSGAAWELVNQNIKENNTIENIEVLLKTAKKNNIRVFVSPHFYYPHDHEWKFGGTLEKWMHKQNMYYRKSPLSLKGFEGSGADFLTRYKPYIEDGETVITSPHKIYGPENNDLTLQLRKQKIDRVILAGMSANLCVESHMREFLEQGFEVAVVYDATAAAQLPGLDGYAAATINFQMIANAFWSTKEAVREMTLSAAPKK